MKIDLGHGRFALIDDEDAHLVAGLSWNLAQSGYAVSSTHIDGQIVNFYMHRVIAGAGDGELVDHRDRDGLNNRRSNLRLCTYSQNNANAAKRMGCRSRFKGVTWSKQRGGRWHARIKLNGNAKHLGFFNDELEAARAYNAAAPKFFGEFARLNEVQ